MKITFEDKSYIELRKSEGKIILIISAKDHVNKSKKITNAVELTLEEFNLIVTEATS